MPTASASVRAASPRRRSCKSLTEVGAPSSAARLAVAKADAGAGGGGDHHGLALEQVAGFGIGRGWSHAVIPDIEANKARELFAMSVRRRQTTWTTSARA